MHFSWWVEAQVFVSISFTIGLFVNLMRWLTCSLQFASIHLFTLMVPLSYNFSWGQVAVYNWNIFWAKDQCYMKCSQDLNLEWKAEEISFDRRRKRTCTTCAVYQSQCMRKNNVCYEQQLKGAKEILYLESVEDDDSWYIHVSFRIKWISTPFLSLVASSSISARDFFSLSFQCTVLLLSILLWFQVAQFWRYYGFMIANPSSLARGEIFFISSD